MPEQSRDFNPCWASPPGETIASILADRGISHDAFARRVGRPIESTRLILNGEERITAALAKRIEHLLGGSAEFWITRDAQYIADLERVTKEWLSDLPLREMAAFGWIRPRDGRNVGASECLEFFGVANVTEWWKSYGGLGPLPAFRTSPNYSSKPAALAAWLRRGEIAAHEIDCGPFSPERLRKTLQLVRSLTQKKDFDSAIRDLQHACARCGVAVVVVEAPSECRASGATWFLPDGKAVILLSYRYKTQDGIWFTFFHEAGHLILHSSDRMFIETEEDGLDQAEEKEANDFAANVLIPKDRWEDMMSLPVDARSIVRFAVQIGVAPGIVVGQLQHHGRIPRSALNKLRRRIKAPR